jgi:hypothetical protein
MAKTWKPKLPKAFQPWKPPKMADPFKLPKFSDPFKLPKEPKYVEPPHVMTMYERELIRMLCPVISEKRLIRFWYEDRTTNFADWRIIEPHLIGQVKYKSENIWLSGWFLPTEEQKMDGHFQDWGNYILDDVKKVEILGSVYRITRPRYNPRDKRMNTIFCATSERVI